MEIYAKDVVPLGFKGNGMFSDSKWHHYCLEQPKKRRFYIISNVDNSITHFNLSAREYQLYKRNRLSLIPLGCCDAGCGTRETKEDPEVDFLGDFDSCFLNRKSFHSQTF